MIMKEYWCLTVIKGQGKKQAVPKISPAWIHETSSRAVNNNSTPTAFSPWTFPHDSNAQVRKSGWVTLATVSSLFSWSVCQERKERAGLEQSRYSSWRRQWHPTPALLPGKSHGRRSLVGRSLWGRKLDTTEWLHFHFSLSCIGEGNGSLLQCGCLENLRDGGASWAAVYGVTQSRTRLNWLSREYKWIHNDRKQASGCLGVRGERDGFPS